MESLQFLKEEVAERDRAPRPHARIEREVNEMLEDFMEDKEVGGSAAHKVEVEIVEEEHDVRYGVDITAVEEDPVEKIDVSLPGNPPSPFSFSPPHPPPPPTPSLFPLPLLVLSPYPSLFLSSSPSPLHVSLLDAPPPSSSTPCLPPPYAQSMFIMPQWMIGGTRGLQ